MLNLVVADSADVERVVSTEARADPDIRASLVDGREHVLFPFRYVVARDIDPALVGIEDEFEFRRTKQRKADDIDRVVARNGERDDQIVADFCGDEIDGLHLPSVSNVLDGCDLAVI